MTTLPALDVDKPTASPEFDPFARDARLGVLTAADMHKIAGTAAPPRVLVPIAIEGAKKS